MNLAQTTSSPIGALLRDWRMKRRMSQLDLSAEADVSQRHLSFIESGRAAPSREMVLRLAERLTVPLRQQNQLLMAAGFAPQYPERETSDPALAPAMAAVRQVLKSHEPNPAFAIDGHWNLIEANAVLPPFLALVEDAALTKPPINVMRLVLHPKGLAPHVVNLREYRDHLLLRLRRQNDAAADPKITELEKEFAAYQAGPRTSIPLHPDAAMIAHPFRIRMPGAILTFISTLSVFGTALDVTLSEIAIESFFPADEETSQFLREMMAKKA